MRPALLILVLASSVLLTTAIDVCLREVAAGQFTEPLFLTHASDGTNRRFVIERAGLIKVPRFTHSWSLTLSMMMMMREIQVLDEDGYPDGNVLPGNILDVRATTTTSNEHGVLGIAFHPECNGTLFYVYRSDTQCTRRLA